MGAFDQFKSAKQGQFGEVGNIWHGMFNPDADITPPERKNVELDQSTQNLMADREKQAAMSPEELVKKQMSGVQQDSDAAFRDQGLVSQGFGGAGNPFSAAIQQKQAKNYLRDMNKLQRQAEYEAPLQKQKLMQSVMQDRLSKASIAAGAADRDREQQLIQYENDVHQRQVRNGIISGLFSTMTSFGGAIAGKESVKGSSKRKSVSEQAAEPQAGQSYKNYGGYA